MHVCVSKLHTQVCDPRLRVFSESSGADDGDGRTSQRWLGGREGGVLQSEGEGHGTRSYGDVRVIHHLWVGLIP